MTRTSHEATCVILAGGLGTRLRGVLGDRPKVLAPVGSRAFLDLQLAQLQAEGVTQVVLSLGYRADLVLHALAERSPPLPVRTVVETRQLGTGGAVAHVLDSLSLDEVWVANGDTFLDGNLSALHAPLDREGGELFRMAAVRVPDRARFGGLEADATGRVTRFLEKGQAGPGLINAGLYRLCRAALPPARGDAFSLESDVLPGLVAGRNVSLVAIDGTFIDIGVPADYERFCAQHAA